MEKGYVYLLAEIDQNGQEKYKIGITKNSPEKRLKKLKTGNSNDLFIIKTYISENYKRIEKWLHLKYKSKRTLSKNEFFYLTSEEVLKFNETCKDAENTIKFLKNNNPFFK